MSNNLTKLIASFFYMGYVPLAPGSLASFAGGLIYVCFSQQPFLYGILFFVIVILGFLLSGRLEAITKTKDPSCVVIDEVAGVMIAFYGLPVQFNVFIVTFFLFRAFDMFKIYPAGEMEKAKGSVGIMMDDIVAGIYTNIVMQIAIHWAGVV